MRHTSTSTPLTPHSAPHIAPRGERQGRVTLVGAGPGDPELLTLKAVKAIAQATVLLVDDLVNPAVLVHAHPHARIVHVGKRGGCQSTPQAFIERLMLQEAQQGEQVVRLKGGDPMLFGRAGEEIAALQAHGVEVEVVNGITAGWAAATSVLTPLTHRDHAQGVLFVTGHAKPGDASPDWVMLGETAHRAKLTVVIYMGLTHLTTIVQGLRHSLPDHTPVVMVQHATLPHQRQWVTTLDGCVQTVELHRIVSPAIVMVGEVGHIAALSPMAQAQEEPSPTIGLTRSA